MKRQVHHLFFYTALVFGSILCFLLPPFQSPDEPNHFFRAFQVSEGCFFSEKTEDMRLGGSLPNSLDSLQTAFLFLKNDYAARCTLPQILRYLNRPLAVQQRGFIDFPNTAIYVPTAYFPQATAVFLGKNLGFSPLCLLYLSRFFNLLVWASIVAAAIRMLPFGKKTMTYLALLPASLIIAASCNADVLTNALCFWVFAFFLKNTQSQGLSKSLYLKKAKASTALILIALQKIVFAPFALLVFLSFFEKNIKMDKKALISPLLLALVVFSAAFLWAKTSGHLFIPFDEYNPAYQNAQTLNEGVNPDKQLAHILAQPFLFLKTTLLSFADALPSTSAHVVGKFGWEKNYLPSGMVAALWFALFALLFVEKTELGKVQRGLLGCIVLSCIALFSVTMYCLWMPVGSPVLGNLQGRYFVPVLLLLCFAGLWRRDVFPSKTEEKWLGLAVLSILLFGNIAMCFAVFSRYWG